MRIPKGKMQGLRIMLHGGPWGGMYVVIPTNGTMVFKLGKWHGYYGRVGGWFDA